MSKKIIFFLLLPITYHLLPASTLWAGVCYNNYCHGEIGISAYNAENVDPVSTNTATGKCGTCHRAGKFSDSAARTTGNQTIPNLSTAPPGGSHYRHASTTTYNYSCKLCHSATLTNWGTSASNVTISTSYHVVNRATDIQFSTYNLTRPQLALGISSPTYADINAYDGVYSTSPPNTPYEKCANLYCHGTITTKYAVGRSTPLWGTPSDGACGTCHAVGKFAYNLSDVKQATAPVGGSHYRHTSTTTYNYSCKYCHDEVLTNWVSNWTVPLSFSSHTNYATNIKFSTHNPQGKYNLVTSSVISPPRDTYPTDAKCNNLYCHGRISDQYIVTMATPAWTGDARCGTCHGAGKYGVAGSSPPPVGWKHTKHVSTNTYNYSCRLCHEGTVNWSGGIQITTAHVQNLVDIRFSTSTLTANATYWAGGTAYTYYVGAATSEPNGNYWNRACANFYCHSNAGPRDGTNNYVKVYSTDTITCTSCHEGQGSGSGTGLSVSHATHTRTTGYNFSCEQCHFNTATGTSTIKNYDYHVDGDTDVVFATTWSGNYDAPRCSNTYCHGNFPGSGYNTNIATWNVIATARCGSCHGTGRYDVVRSTAPSGWKHYKHVSTTTYNYPCKVCHNQTVDTSGSIISYSSHVATKKVDVKFATSTYTNVVFATTTYRGTTYYSYATTGTYNNAVCSNTYCHSNANPYAGTNVYDSVYSTETLTCTFCHAGAGQTGGTNLTVAHGTHTRTTGYAYTCDKCHYDTVQENSTSTIKSYLTHLSTGSSVSNRSVVFSTNTAYYTQASTRACNNVYCHSAGTTTWNRGVATSYIRWTDTGTVGCNSCHREPALGGPNYYFDQAPYGGKPNAHQKHTSSSTFNYDCYICHYNVMTSTNYVVNYATNHANGYYNCVASGAGVGFNYTFSSVPTPSRCNDIACHGGTGRYAFWSDTMPVSCLDCHGAINDTDDFVVGLATNTFKSYISTGQWYASGHGLSTSSVYGVSGSSGAGFATCLYCHDNKINHKNNTNPFRLVNSTLTAGASIEQRNGVCLICHKDGDDGYLGKNSEKNVNTAHFGSKHSTSTQGGYFCWDCHDPHGDREGASGNIYMVHTDSVTRVSDGNYGYWGSTTATPGAIVYTVFKSTTPGENYNFYADTFTPYNGPCNVCHTSADHFRWNVGESTHNFNSRCTSCHTHKAGFQAACNQCHGYPPNQYDGKSLSTYYGNPGGKGAHVTYDNAGSTTSGHLVLGTLNPNGDSYSPSNTQCNQCHDLSITSNHNQNNQIDVDTATLNVVIFSTSSYNGYAVYNSTPGSGDWNNRYCLNSACHFGRKSPVWSSPP